MKSQTKGIQLSLLCLLILGILPIIATVRTNDGNALAFAFWISFWQLAFAAPVYLVQRKQAQVSGALHKRPAGKIRANSATQPRFQFLA